MLDNRDDYGTVDILYGSRSADDLVQLKEIQEVWMKAKDVHVHLTIDREQEGWDEMCIRDSHARRSVQKMRFHLQTGNL